MIIKKWVDNILSWFEKYWFVSFLMTIFIACLIFYVSSIPASGFIAGGFGLKAKIYHIGIFFLLGFFLALAIIRKKINNNNAQVRYLIIIVLLLAIAYAISDELHQFFVPGRHCTFRDVFIDATGAMMAIVFYYALRE